MDELYDEEKISSCFYFFYQHACCLVTYISVVTLGYHTVELGIPNVSSFFL